MNLREMQDFIEWYWKEIDGKPYRCTSLEVAEWYLNDKNKQYEKH